MPDLADATLAAEPAGTAGSQEICLRVPAGLVSQLVFRQQPMQPFDAAVPTGAEFVYCRSTTEFAPYFRRFAKITGTGSAVRAAIKLSTSRRSWYAMLCDGEIQHHGWITAGRCRYYHVEPDAFVIGPIWTSAKSRGRGLATAATCLAMNEWLSLGEATFYIDTSTDNAPCLKVIERCGFGSPLGAFVRRESVAGS
jgi:hypothetical protein